MNDGYLFFWQSVAMLDMSGERLPGSEQGQLLLCEKFSVFRYHTSEQWCIVLTNVSGNCSKESSSIILSEMLSSVSSLHNL